jgi:hypothetical protein
MISFHNFYQVTHIQDMIYFHTWAAVQLTQNLILSLARPPRKYQKDLTSTINTMFWSLERVEVRRREGAEERSKGGSEEAKGGEARGDGSYGGYKPILLFERLNL